MADRRAEKPGYARLPYRAKYHHYPKNLEALAPEFVSSVPVAKYGILGDDGFSYYPKRATGWSMSVMAGVRQLRSWKLLKIDVPCPESREFASLRAGIATINPY